MNVIIEHPNQTAEDWDVLERIALDGEPYERVPYGTKLIDILVKFRFFKSKNEVRKNWRYSFCLKERLNYFKDLGKLRKHLFILRIPDDLPPESDREYD